MRAVAIAYGLRTTSAYTPLKLPVVDDMEHVLAATILPTVLLDADPAPDTWMVQRWAAATNAPQVRELVVGQALLYLPDADEGEARDAVDLAVDRRVLVATAVDAAAAVHSGRCTFRNGRSIGRRPCTTADRRFGAGVRS